jgi:hypothetical protein
MHAMNTQKINPECGGARISVSSYIERPHLIKWIRRIFLKINPVSTLNDAVLLSDFLLLGDIWISDQYWFWNSSKDDLPEFINIELIEPVNESTVFFREQEKYYELLKLGASGNVEAAIAYCKAELEDKISHGAFAG